jgi:hypothetical protein
MLELPWEDVGGKILIIFGVLLAAFVVGALATCDADG